MSRVVWFQKLGALPPWVFFFVSMCFALGASHVWGLQEGEQLPPKEVLTRSDRARGNLEGVAWNLTINSLDSNYRESRFFEIQARGYDFLAITLNPAKVKGQKLLMVNHNMWFYKPGLSKPVPLSPRQKLMGAASYGDIAATNYAEDYEASLIREEDVNDEPCYLFDLKALHKKVTYDRILYWVSKERFVGVQAEYYTVSGKLFKRAQFEYDHKLGDPQNPQPFISRMIITEIVTPDAKTHLLFSEPQLRTIPATNFNVNLLMSQ